MATMVKEKRKEKKKKVRDKNASLPSHEPEIDAAERLGESAVNNILKQLEQADTTLKTLPEPSQSNVLDETVERNQPESSQTLKKENSGTSLNEETKVLAQSMNECIKTLNSKLEEISVTPNLENIINNEEVVIETPQSPNLRNFEYNTSIEVSPLKTEEAVEDCEELLPSAPHLEANTVQGTVVIPKSEDVKVKCEKRKCMSLEEAIRLFGLREIMEVMEMSEREEAFVETGPCVGADHPLVDLLHTLRCSLSAVERERVNLARGYAEEEKSRAALWKIEKKYITVSEKCKCGADVTVRASYEYAELLKNKMPAAKMRLEALRRDVQESYCHHQHAALLAHYQIEELIAETLNRGKPEIRIALSLILQELRLSESGSEAICGALRRWARALAAALLGNRDPRQLLFLLHHLFRQSRSVQWAAKLLTGLVSAGDLSAARSAVALLDVALAGGKVAEGRECIEEMEEIWEEIDKSGEGGAVSDGSLRERDLLALFHAFPTRDIVARLALIRHQDITQAVEYEWGDASGGRGVLKSVCGARTLLAVLQRAVRANERYERLISELVTFGEQAAWAVADLHEYARSSYIPELRDVISRELEACFAAIFTLCVSGNAPLSHLPFRLLAEDGCEVMAAAVIAALHETSSTKIEEVDVELPSKLNCEAKVRILTEMALDRSTDYKLARKVLEFLFQTGIKRKQSSCKMGCKTAARESISGLLTRHPYLYPAGFSLLVEAEHDNIETSMKLLSPEKWRPSPHEAISVLNQCVRAPKSIPALLLSVECTPYVGLSLETQLAISTWLVQHQAASSPAAVPEWCWGVFRRLALHRTWWGLPPGAGAAVGAEGLFGETVEMMATELSHQVPLICEYAIKTLERLARAGRVREAAHCLGPIMVVMAQSPESITYTPKFTEVMGLIVDCSPSLLQRALGREAPLGAALLQHLLAAQLSSAALHGNQQAIFATWLRALWPLAGARGVLEAAAGAGGAAGVAALPQHFAALVQEQNSQEILTSSVRYASVAPALCWGGCCAGAGLEAAWPRLLGELHARRTRNERTHVDNTLKQIDWAITSDDLVIHKVATALLVAPLSSPAHLLLWKLFFHLYLQRPSSDMRDATPPVGPLFFSGILKSRTLSQLKRRLQETIAYHSSEGARLHSEGQLMNQRIEAHKPDEAQEEKPKSTTTSFLPPLSLGSAEGSESSSEESDSCDINEEEKRTLGEACRLRSVYHMAYALPLAEKFLSWLEEGEAVRATPAHECLIAQTHFEEIKAAWEAELHRTTPPLSPLDETLPPFPPAPPAAPPPVSPLQRLVERLKKYKSGKRRRSKPVVIKSPLEGAPRDPRTLLRTLDQQLREIETLDKEWSEDVSRASRLDESLWPLVTSLRTRRPAPPIRRACANRCKPITLVVPVEEWCISTRAERSIEENRTNSRAALSRAARPRPAAARAAAALHCLIRQVRDKETACAVAGRLRGCAGADAVWASVAATLADLCEKYISEDASRCVSLLTGWRSSCLQRAAAAALVSPRRLTRCLPLYTAILQTNMQPSEAFRCLSKFEPSVLSSLDPTERREALAAITAAAQKLGGEEQLVLLELLGVHTEALTSSAELPFLVSSSARASAAAALPPAHWPHVLRAVETHAASTPFDQLGHTLRELGAAWRDARACLSEGDARLAPYAAPTAAALHALTHAFIDAALDQHFTTDQVAWYAWSATIEAWSPWVSPAGGAPLLPAGEGALALMQKFLNQLRGIIESCVGSEPYIYQELFEWTVQSVLSGLTPRAPSHCRPQLAVLLEEELKLDWSRQWFAARCMPALMQLCSTQDKESLTWASTILRETSCAAWLSGVPHEHLAPHLAAILHVFTSLPFTDETIEEATRLPWWRLPAAALEPSLEGFYAARHSASTPYHSMPCFKLMLYASELSVHSSINTFATRQGASEKRHSSISLYIRSLSHPALQAHVAKGTRCLLDTITALAPNVESCQGELESLLTRASALLCTEPAGAAALPVWVSWVSSAPARVLAATLTALASLTTFDHYAVLADAAVKAFMLCDESTGWQEVRNRWLRSHWQSCAPLCARARLHAAYGTRITHEHYAHDVALHTVEMDFIENEVIVAAWICLLRRSKDTASLAAWAVEPRRSLLRTITGQNSDRPTNKHRLLCRLALCILTPNDETAIQAYEAYIPTVLGSNPGSAAAWGRDPKPEYLPRLAMKLFPKEERYFRFELELAR